VPERHRKQRAPRLKRPIAHVPGGYIPEAEMASELNLRPRTLRKWRAQGKGPAFIKIGRRVFYRDASRDAWLRRQEVEPVRSAEAASA
jgi:Helix-turn-helix domain